MLTVCEVNGLERCLCGRQVLAATLLVNQNVYLPVISEPIYNLIHYLRKS